MSMGKLIQPWKARTNRDKRDRDLDIAFENALRPHITALYRMAWRWCDNPEETEELIQAVLCKLYPRRSELLSVNNLRPWLTRVLYHEFVDSYRRRKTQPTSIDTTQSSESPNQTVADTLTEQANVPEQLFESALLQQQLIHALQVLTEEQRVLVIMHDVEGYTLNEISAVLNAPIGTLKSRLHRSREKLRDLLNPDGTLSGDETCNNSED